MLAKVQCPNIGTFDQNCRWIYPLSVGAGSNLEFTCEDSTVYMLCNVIKPVDKSN